MKFTVLNPEWNYYKSVRYPKTNKLFIDGEQTDRDVRPYWYSECEDYETVGSNLHPLYLAIKDIHENNKNRIVLQEQIIHKEAATEEEPKELLRASASAGYFEKNCYWEWFLLEFDEGMLGSNLLSTDELLPIIRAEVDFLTGDTEMIVRRSNKHGLSTYPDHYSLHIYIRLDTPQTPKQIKGLLSGWGHIVDLRVFTNCRGYWVQPPEVLGKVLRTPIDHEVRYIPGDAVALDTIRSSPQYKENREIEARFTTTLHNLQDFSIDGVELQTFQQLAQHGYFTNNRYEPLYKILASAEWKHQNGAQVKEVLLKDAEVAKENGTIPIIGYERNRKSLDTQLAAIQENNRLYFSSFLENHDFTHKLSDPKVADLRDADLSSLLNLIKNNFKKKIPLVNVIKSAYGSAKTTAVVPKVIEAMQSVIKEPLVVLYISTLRSIIRGTCEELQFACYISEGNIIDEVQIVTAEKLGMGLLSLQHYTRKAPHLLIVDESEQAGMWAEWDNRNHNRLVDLIASTPITILQDADAADMTYSMVSRAVGKSDTETCLLHNSESWIHIQNQRLVLVQKEIQIYEEIVERVARDEFIYLHTDLSDKKLEVTAIVNAFNEYFGEEVAIGFTDQSPQDKKLSLTNNTNQYLASLHKQGIRIIISSPIWQSGLRYTGIPRFNATFGLYRGNYITANMICQRTQRGVAVIPHYVFVNPTSNWTDIRKLKTELEEYFHIPQEHSVAGWDREIDKVELKQEAMVIRQKHLSNVKLNLCIKWLSYGGALQFLTPLGTSEEDESFQQFRALIKQCKAEARLARAEAILHDEYKLASLTTRFTKSFKMDEFDGLLEFEDIDTPTTAGDVLELLDLVELEALHHETAKDIYNILQYEEMDWMRWDLIGAPWKQVDFSQLAAPTDDKTEYGYRVLGALMQRIVDLIGNKDVKDGAKLLQFLSIPNAKLVLDRDVDYIPITKLMHNRKELLKTRLDNIFSPSMSAERFISNIFRKILLCEVTSFTPVAGKVAKAKQELVAEYKKRELIPTVGYKLLKKSLPRCKQILKEKLLNGEELSEVESRFIQDTGSIITITNGGILSTTRLEWIKYLRAGLLKDEPQEATT